MGEANGSNGREVLMSRRKILMVDDEANILSGYKRHLRQKYQISTATSAKEGITLFDEDDPFAVVVSDQRMPEVDGVTFLTMVKEKSPHTVRIMLTGQADMEETIGAVNEGNIFRFLTKPCDHDTLSKAIDAGIAQYDLIQAEKEILDKTLKRSIKVLVEILSLVNPYAFGRSSRIYRMVSKLSEAIKYSKLWDIEIATLLSHIGLITIPEGILSKVFRGKDLLPEENTIYEDHPDAGYRLISSIPRLEGVSMILRDQKKSFDKEEYEAATDDDKAILLGRHIINLALDFDYLVVTEQKTEPAALAEIIKGERAGKYNPEVVDVLKEVICPSRMPITIDSIEALTPGMLIAQAVVDSKGKMMLSEGCEINEPVIKRLINLSRTTKIQFPINVWDDGAEESEKAVVESEESEKAEGLNSPTT